MNKYVKDVKIKEGTHAKLKKISEDTGLKMTMVADALLDKAADDLGKSQNLFNLIAKKGE